jgi:hypothetical protein
MLPLGIAHCADCRRVFHYMSARENQQMGCYLRSDKAAQESAGSPLQDRRGAARSDVSVLNDIRGRFKLQDNERTQIVAERLLEPAFCLRAGRRYEATAPILPRAVAA